MWKKVVVVLLIGGIFLPYGRSASGILADDAVTGETQDNQVADGLFYRTEEERIRDLLHVQSEMATRRNESILFMKKVNFGIPGGDNWLVEWSESYDKTLANLFVYSINDHVIKNSYNLGITYNMLSRTKFDIMKDIPGTHIGDGTSSVGDFNGDGLDEIFQYGFFGRGNTVLIYGYSVQENEVVYYCSIPFDIIDDENGPAPVEFMTYKGMDGFKVYYVMPSVAGGPDYVYAPAPDNWKWYFYTWDEVEWKYLRVEEIVDEPFLAAEPEEEATVPPPPPAAEAETIEEDIPVVETVAVTSSRPVFFMVIAAVLFTTGILLVIVVLWKRKKRFV